MKNPKSKYSDKDQYYNKNREGFTTESPSLTFLHQPYLFSAYTFHYFKFRLACNNCCIFIFPIICVTIHQNDPERRLHAIPGKGCLRSFFLALPGKQGIHLFIITGYPAIKEGFEKEIPALEGPVIIFGACLFRIFSRRY